VKSEEKSSTTGSLGLRILGLVVIAGLLCWTSVAASAPSPVLPEAGATTSSHPVFSWTLGPDEESDMVYIANEPETTPEGRFHTENLVMIGAVTESRSTAWSPAEALFAGRHWWNVESRDADFSPVYSATREFTVATELRLLSARLSRYPVNRQVTTDLRWVTNSQYVTIEVRFVWRGRVIGIVRRREETLVSREPDRTALTWQAPQRVPPGARLRATVRITGTGKSTIAQRLLRAP
jgi:hypothetical protein